MSARINQVENDDAECARPTQLELLQQRRLFG